LVVDIFAWLSLLMKKGGKKYGVMEVEEEGGGGKRRKRQAKRRFQVGRARRLSSSKVSASHMFSCRRRGRESKISLWDAGEAKRR